VSQQATRLEVDEYHPQDPYSPLRNFWLDILDVNPDFVTSHSHQLWDRDDAYLNVVLLLNFWSWERWQNTHYRRSIDSAMFTVATEFLRRRLPHTEASFPETQRQRYFMMYTEDLSQDGGELISWKPLSAYHEASYVLKLRHTAGQLAWDDTQYEFDQPRTRETLLDQPLGCEKSMEIDILRTYCALIQGWQMFQGIPHYAQGTPLPLQISLPLLSKYPPTSRYLNNAEIEKVLSYRTEKRLNISCFARRGPGKLRQAEKQHIPVSSIASYCLSSATTIALLVFSNVDHRHYNGTRFVGSAAEISACVGLVMDDMWNDAEDQLTAWEQLYLRACVKIYFERFWTRKP